MAKVALLLAGSPGYLDGNAAQEVVCTMLYLDLAGAELQAFAPDKPQMHVVNHLTGEEAPGESRNVLVESARIVRGNIRDSATLKAADFDALFIPGGYGVAKNLCTFAVDGPDCSVDPGIAAILRDFHSSGKAICAICIAPALIAKVLGDQAPSLTIGTEKDTAAALEKLGASHVACAVREFTVDEKNKIVSTPAYMLGPGIKDVAAGIEAAVKATLELL